MKNIMIGLFLTLSTMASGAWAHGDHDHGGQHDHHMVFSGGVHARLFWEVGPREGDPSQLRIEFMNAATHSPTDIQAVPEVELWMSSMGHGSAPTRIQKVEQGQAGVYRVTEVYFIMGGEWELRLKLKKANGEVETQKVMIMIGDGDHGGGHHH